LRRPLLYDRCIFVTMDWLAEHAGGCRRTGEGARVGY